MYEPSPAAMRLLVLRMLVLATAVAMVFLLLTSADADEPPAPTTRHVVTAGDTLWALAAGIAPEGADLRPVVSRIMELNHLEEGVIRPGQELLLPSG